MKPFIQKLPVAERTSFVARTYTTPLYETSWHKHNEVELILQLSGNGMCFIGNAVGNFKEGDVFLLGSDLPHEFRKEYDTMKCSVLVIHFLPDFLGEDFWKIPESAEIKMLLHQSLSAIKISDQFNTELGLILQKLETAAGFERITMLCECLLRISRDKTKQSLSTLDVDHLPQFTDDKINRIFEYTINGFRDPIALATVASIANLSISAFCRYFKRNTKKTYIEFVNEMRIGYACNSIVHTDKTILQIAFDCGFNTIANFNRQFLKIKGVKPSVYRKKFRL